MPRPRKPANPFRYFHSSPEVIRLVVMLYVRFPLSLRNVEDLLFERGIDICHETVRLWWNRFGPMFAADIRRQRVSRMKGFRHWRWHLDEVYVKINGEMHYLWRAVDHEGEVLESYVTKTRDKAAALRFMRKALKRHGQAEAIVTDGLKSYPAAMRELGNEVRREVGRHANNRVENSHLIDARRPGANVWCSMASFDSPNVRDAASAGQLKAFWFDVDAHGKPYTDPNECSVAISRFVQTTGLARPNYLHMTGHGVQAFWVLPQAITREDWQPVADALQELGKRHSLGADPITADAARILRVPATLNFRDPEYPRDTVLHVLKAGYTDFDAFRCAITGALAKLPSA